MRLNKQSRQEKKARKANKDKVEKTPTRRQKKRSTTQALLKEEKMSAKYEAWELSKRDAKESRKLVFRRAVGRDMAVRAYLDSLVMQAWGTYPYVSNTFDP